MAIINHYLGGNQIPHGKTKIFVEKKCLLCAKMFTNGFVCYGHTAFKQPNPQFSQRRESEAGDIAQKIILYFTGPRESVWRWWFSESKVILLDPSPREFLELALTKISTCNDQQCQSATRTGQFSVQNNTFKSCLSSFLSFEPSFLLPDAQSQPGPCSSSPPVNGSKFPAKASLGA